MGRRYRRVAERLWARAKVVVGDLDTSVAGVRRPVRGEMRLGLSGRINGMNVRTILAAAVLCASAAAQHEAYHAYVAQVEALQRGGAELAHQIGRDALIQRYRDLIDANPGFANNIQLETQIAMLYESDFSDKGQPPDLHTAYETYLEIMETYDASHPYMVTVRRLAADRAADVDPDAAVGLYESLIQDYPEEDAVVVHSTYSLAKLAASRGDAETAQQYYDQVLGYVPTGSASEADLARIDVYRSNAAAKLLADAIKDAETPQERMKALKKFLEKHRDLMEAHSDLVQRFAQAIERTGGNDTNVATAQNATVEALIASLKKRSGGRRAGAEERERTRARELRARELAAQLAPPVNTDATLVQSMPVSDASASGESGAGKGIGAEWRYPALGVTALILAVAALQVYRRRRAA